MADLTTYAQVEAELAATASYRSNKSVSEAKRRLDALTRKLDFAEQSDENGRMIRFNFKQVENQISAVEFYVRNNEELTDAERLANPDVIHSDFSTFGGYSQ